MKIELTFGEINASIPAMSNIVKARLPYDISFSVYQIAKTMDEANDYFVKKVKEIQESATDNSQDELIKLRDTKVSLNADQIDKKKLFDALAMADVKLTAIELLSLEKITIPESEEKFTIID